AISTNETYFFRDQAPFKLLQYKIIPDVIDKRSKKQRGIRPSLRIWSAANSTGQEIYSIAMILLEMGITSEKYNIRLFGTDISNTAISQATSGIYNRFEVSRGLDPKWLHKYFVPHNDKYQIKDELKRMVQFRTMNLMNPFAGIGKFDIILCRNVMIYFTAQTRKKIYTHLSSSMEKDGYLLIGSTESLVNDTDLFVSSKYLNSIFYQLK
ncbi:MAG: chemotaxis protein CheR, partial [Desulfobacterales bacterium]